MNNINDILHKTYQRIGSTSGDTFYASQLDGEFIIFSNGARIKLTTLLSDFQLVNSNNTAMNENAQHVQTPDVNPDTFFNATPVLPEVKTVDHLQIKDQPSVIEGKTALNNAQPGLNFGNETTQPGLNFGNETTQPQPQQSNRLPEWDSFDRVKKSKDVELNVTIKIKLPKARHIESINDMYETSFVAYLAKQYMNDSSNIQKQLREAIEEWVDIEMNGGKAKKKKVSKTVTAKKAGKKKDKIEFELKVPSGATVKITEPGSAASMFGQQPIVKDVTKLAMISDNEQYEAAKLHLSKLDPKHKEYDRFESMINIWEDEQQINK